MRHFKTSSVAIIAALVALVALAGGTGYAAGKINGKSIKAHSIPANRLVKNVTVSNAARLGGRRPSAYVQRSADNSGFVAIPADGKMHTVFVRSPLVWKANCDTAGALNKVQLWIYPTESANFTSGSGDLGSTVPAGGLDADNYGTTGPINSSAPYSVLGADHATYSGFLQITLDMYGATCGASVSAIG